MKIYTKTGDDGTTSLFGGKRVSKDNIYVRSYGALDELNCHLGLLLSFVNDDALKPDLLYIQHTLFLIGSLVASAWSKKTPHLLELKEESVTFLENRIDDLDAKLPPLQSFILPGGGKASAFCQLARTSCRRAERLLIFLKNNEKTIDGIIIIFMNRLSDYLFVLARTLNAREGVGDIVWDQQAKPPQRILNTKNE